jgi:arginase
VIGWSNPSQSRQAGINSVSLADVRRSGAAETARQALKAIPASAPIVLHFDIDVLQRREMPAAYFPHAEGLRLSEASELLGVLLKDPRIRIFEISEYASLRDLDRNYIKKLVDLLCEGMKG